MVLRACSVALLVATADRVQAQERRSPIHLGAGAALALATTSVGGETATDVGPLLSGLVGVALSSRTALTAEVAWQLFRAHNPVRDEAFRAVYGMAGLQVMVGAARRVYLRPAVGFVVRSWSGTDVFVESETSLAAGVAIGAQLPVAQALSLAPEGFVRLSGADELSTVLFGLGLSVMPLGPRPKAP